MESKRRVIAHVTEIDKEIRVSPNGDYNYRAVSTTLIFDSYRDFDNYKRGTEIDNADTTVPTARIIDWWWWYD